MNSSASRLFPGGIGLDGPSSVLDARLLSLHSQPRHSINAATGATPSASDRGPAGAEAEAALLLTRTAPAYSDSEDVDSGADDDDAVRAFRAQLRAQTAHMAGRLRRALTGSTAEVARKASDVVWSAEALGLLLGRLRE